MVMSPFITNYYNERHQGQVVDSYDDAVRRQEQTKLDEELEKARAYNEELVGNVVLSDPFNLEGLREQNEEYAGLLNVADDGVMGYIKIPAVDINLPIYHGTADEALEKGVGHLENTSLPVGGTGTHCVLSGHTGLPGSLLFTDLDKLEEKDQFYLYVLDQKLAYEVDQIKVVEPTEIRDLYIDIDQDYVTLVTCTPYGINSHRLLVRGHRIPYVEEAVVQQQKNLSIHKDTWRETYRKALWIAGIALFLVILAILLIVSARTMRNADRKKRKRRGRKRGHKR